MTPRPSAAEGQLLIMGWQEGVVSDGWLKGKPIYQIKTEARLGGKGGQVVMEIVRRLGLSDRCPVHRTPIKPARPIDPGPLSL